MTLSLLLGKTHSCYQLRLVLHYFTLEEAFKSETKVSFMLYSSYALLRQLICITEIVYIYKAPELKLLTNYIKIGNQCSWQAVFLFSSQFKTNQRHMLEANTYQYNIHL